jgi:hypothetical protein
MDRDEKQAFKRWLTTAGDKELQIALVKMQALEKGYGDQTYRKVG